MTSSVSIARRCWRSAARRDVAHYAKCWLIPKLTKPSYASESRRWKALQDVLAQIARLTEE